MVCPFDGHSPSNSTGGASPRLVPSRPAQHVRIVCPVPSRKPPNRSTRCERLVSASPISPKLSDRLAGLCVDLPADHAPRRRRLLWAYASVSKDFTAACSLRIRQSHRSSLVQDLCNADVFKPLCVGQNSQSLLLHILTGAVVGETKKHRLTPSCI